MVQHEHIWKHMEELRYSSEHMFANSQIYEKVLCHVYIEDSVHIQSHRLTYSHSWGLPNEYIRIRIRMHEKIFVKKKKKNFILFSFLYI